MKKVKINPYKTPYSITQKETYINWELALKKVKIGDIARTQELMWLSESWVTCACGNQCEIIPRAQSGFFKGRPKDKDLRDLGLKFNEYVDELYIMTEDDNPSRCAKLQFNKTRAKALAVLGKIEKRSAELIKEIRKTQK